MRVNLRYSIHTHAALYSVCIAHTAPPTTAYSRPTTAYSRPTTAYSLPTTAYSQPTTAYSLPLHFHYLALTHDLPLHTHDLPLHTHYHCILTTYHCTLATYHCILTTYLPLHSHHHRILTTHTLYVRAAGAVAGKEGEDPSTKLAGKWAKIFSWVSLILTPDAQTKTGRWCVSASCHAVVRARKSKFWLHSGPPNTMGRVCYGFAHAREQV